MNDIRRFVVKLDYCDGDPGIALATVQGHGATRWSKFQQSIAG